MGPPVLSGMNHKPWNGLNWAGWPRLASHNCTRVSDTDKSIVGAASWVVSSDVIRVRIYWSGVEQTRYDYAPLLNSRHLGFSLC